MTSVIKLGGSLLDDPRRRANALLEIVSRWSEGEQLVVVHGGGKHIDAMLARLGIVKRTYAGLRITDDETLPIVVATLAGTVNKALVAELHSLGAEAAGLAGSDAATIVAEPHPPIDGVELGHVGRVVTSHATLLQAMLASGFLPVVASIAQGPGASLLNVNADSAAAAIAVALGAKTLHFITDVAGLLDASGNVIPHLAEADVEKFLASEAVSGGMRPKLEAALSALRAGVTSIGIGELTEGGTNLVAA
ncbi:MAG: acetylglutamate kinase [Thermoanaerobaculia bacterium]